MSERVATPNCTHVADRAVLFEFGTESSDAAHAAVLTLDRALGCSNVAGLVEVVPGLVNVLVEFDPLLTDHAALEAEVLAVLAGADAATIESRHHELSVCYDSAVAPDLHAVAEACDMSVDAVIEAHLVSDYRVLMYGFAPGYAYMDGVPESIRVPRKPTPVRGVAAGSVIIAGPQCLVTTLEMPSGWSTIGASAVEVLPHEPDGPFLFDPGDTVGFVRIDLATLERQRNERS